MMKYSLCAPNDGDTMTVSAGGGGWSSPVGDERGGNGSGKDRNGASMGNNSNDKAPKRLFTGGPIIVEKDGLRYVGIIVDEDSETDDDPNVDWDYEGNASDQNTANGSNNNPNVKGFGNVRSEDLDIVKQFLEKGKIVANGLIQERGRFLVLDGRFINIVYAKDGIPNSATFVSRFERQGITNRGARASADRAAEKVRNYFQAQDVLTENGLPAVYAVRGTPVASAVSSAPIQFSVAGGGAVAVSTEEQGQLAKRLSEFWSAVSAIATASTVGPIAAVLSLLTYSSKVGVGSDQVTGRTSDTMFSMPSKSLPGANLPKNLGEIAAANGTVNLPTRAAFVEVNGEISLKVFKTGTQQVPAGVKVVAGKYDKDTGTYRVDIDGVPARIILESPAQAPTAGVGNTGSPKPDYNIPTHTGVQVKPVDRITVTTTPAPHPVTFDDLIIWTPPVEGTDVEPIYVVFSNPYGETNAKGKYSGRPYNSNKAGGPIEDLDWRTATIDRAGVDKVKLHTGRFAESDANNVMVDRLEKILKGELQPTDTDKRFYTHEIRELERYRNLGIPDGTLPKDNDTASAVWNNTHTATLEDYKLGRDESLLYTDDALKAAEEQEWRALK